MRHIEIQADRRRLLCDVLVLHPDEPTNLAGFRGRGLIDTGATVSGIGPGVISALGLRSYGKKPLGSATEEKMVAYYLFRLAFEALDIGDPTTPQWPYSFERTDGFSWDRATDFDVIIGMDILLECELRLERGGRCGLAFG